MSNWVSGALYHYYSKGLITWQISSRAEISRIYRICEEEPTFFGPPVITPMPAPVDQVDDEGEMAEIQKKPKIH